MFACKKIVTYRSITNSCRSLYSTETNFPVLNEPVAPAPGRYPVWSDSCSVIFKDMKNGAKVFVQGAASTPSVLSTNLYQHVLENQLKSIEVHQYLPMGPTPFLNKDVEGRIRLDSAYLSSVCRDAVNEGRADFTPISMTEVPLLYRNRDVELDYALVMVSPPDKHGFCSLGASVGTARSAIQNAKIIIGQVNSMAPVTYGDSTIHSSRIDYFVNGPQKLEEMPVPKLNSDEVKIAEIIAQDLVVDGATLQLGYGRIPYAVSAQLRQHKDLGLHAEMFSDGIVDLFQLGVLSNRRKNVRRGRIVASYCLGTLRVFDFVNENPSVALCDIAWVNAPEVIARNPMVTTVNTCFEMDLTGQSVGDSQGPKMMSGVGGQLDFTRAASLSSDGKGRPIITMTSKNSHGQSSIVPYLTDGGGVVATRAHVHYVVTEYGIAYLFGKSLRQRAHALIKIAHPEFRESLEKSAFERLKVMPSP